MTLRLELRCASDPAWLAAVMDDFDAFLLDHAACERKASATALNLVAHYRDRKALVDAMIHLAREELEHFHRVYKLMSERGLCLAPDRKDAYIRALATHHRQGSDAYFMDRLLIAGLVEARGAERFGMIADALAGDPKLGAFYRELAASEAKHRGLFLGLASRYFDQSALESRLSQLLDAEAEIIRGLPLRAALH